MAATRKMEKTLKDTTIGTTDVYPFKEKDGYLYLGKAEPRKEGVNIC